MADANAVARDQLRSFIERIERVEEEIATLNTDKSDIYKEARSVGFDVKVLRKIVAKRKLETHVREEQDAIFDMYWDALYGAPVHVHTHARKNIKEFDAETGEVLDARRSDLGLNIQTKHTDIRTSDGGPVPAGLSSLAARETKESAVSTFSRSAPLAVPGGEPSTPSPDAGGAKMDGADSVIPDRPDDKSACISAKSGRATNFNSPETANETDDGAIAAVNGKAGLANANGVEPPSSEQCAAPEKDAAADGPLRQVTAKSLVRNFSEPKSRLRPNCLHPELCRSGTRDHCYSCRKSMEQKSEVAA